MLQGRFKALKNPLQGLCNGVVGWNIHTSSAAAELVCFKAI